MIYIRNTEDVFTKREAAKWLRDHVVVKKADLRKIGRLAKKHGIYEELKALGMEMHELAGSAEKRAR